MKKRDKIMYNREKTVTKRRLEMWGEKNEKEKNGFSDEKNDTAGDGDQPYSGSGRRDPSVFSASGHEYGGKAADDF